MNHPPSLFERLPPGIFRPLAAGVNYQRNWTVLGLLFDQLWGAGLHSPGEEVEKPRVVRIIESHLIQAGPWTDDAGDPLETPPAILAANLYATLRDAGWLSERLRGVRLMTTVRPVVAQLYDTLADFAERGPEFLGSKVHSIHLNLRQVVEGKDSGGLFHEAARQAARLMSHIANTGVQVFDLMEKLQKVDTPREFIQGFFESYIQKIFIADYLSIRTDNHPLRHRAAIVSDAQRCAHVEELSTPLLQWYTDKLASGDAVRARRLFDRDVGTLLKLDSIEQHLARLDDEIRSANQRALVYLEYRVRAPRSFDQLLARACAGLAHLKEGHIALPAAAPLEPMGPEWLALPPRPPAETRPSEVIRAEPSIEDRALDALRKRMVEARLVTPIKLARYVARHLGEALDLPCEALTIGSIADFCCYQRLLLIAARQAAPSSSAEHDPYARMVPGLRVRFSPGREATSAFGRHRHFTVSREVRR